MISVKFNNTTLQIEDGTTVAQFIEMQKVDASGIAVAVNNRVIAKTEWSTAQLADGDAILIIKAFYGG